MTRDTSIEAYETIVANGLISKRRMEVYQELFHNGPLTANEVVRKYQQTNPNIKDASLNGRFSELERLGVIRDTGELKTDQISGHKCILWDVTSNLPNKIEKKIPFKERKEEILEMLVAHGKKSIPASRQGISLYKQELRDIYHKLKDL